MTAETTKIFSSLAESNAKRYFDAKENGNPVQILVIEQPRVGQPLIESSVTDPARILDHSFGTIVSFEPAGNDDTFWVITDASKKAFEVVIQRPEAQTASPVKASSST